MFLEIFKFEVRYRLKRPATYIYFAILFFLCFFSVTTDTITIGRGSGQVMENAPVVIANMMVILSAFMMMVTSAVMGVPVIRDFEHQTESIMFVNPIKKRDYLFGRFFGSFVILVFIFFGMLLGFMVGEFVPWREADKLGPFQLATYLNPFLYIILPSLFFTGSLFFASGALSRKMIVVYTQGILLLVLYLASFSFVRDLDNSTLSALIDPFGPNTLNLQTQYWTVAERNALQVIPEGNFLLNRLIWSGVGVIALMITYFGFSFNVVRTPLFKRKQKKTKIQDVVSKDIPIPEVSRAFGLKAHVYQLVKQSLFYFKITFKEIPFLAMVISGLALVLVNSANLNKIYGADIYPTTYAMLEMINGSFNLFFLIIVIFYTGELIWKERSVKIDLIYDATPIPDFLNLLSKFFGMVLVYITIILLLIMTGVLVQTAKGYYDYELSVYFSTMFTSTFSFILLFTFLAFFIHVLVNHKFLGHAIIVVFFIISIVLETLGVEHGLVVFAEANLGPYSDMNGYGHFMTSFTWFDIYWFGFACILFAGSVLLAVRGTDSLMKSRLFLSRLRFSRPVMTFTITAFLTFAMSGCYIYYNTNVLNNYRNSDEVQEQQAGYEKELKKYQYAMQPKIVDVNMKVDLYPETRDFTAKGIFTLTNKSEEIINQVHIQGSGDDNARITSLTFENGAKIIEEYSEYRFTIYELNTPMQPGDSLQMEFTTQFTTSGFVESGSSTNVVFNGTFFNNFIFPTLGYSPNFELTEPDDREDQDLPERDRMLPQTDERGLKMALLGDDSDKINFEIVMSTTPDQIAIAPGYLQREWTEDGRRYFHYKMDKPILGFFSMVSARYEVMRDIWISSNGDTVNLEIYYHKGHEYNLDRMMSSMKKSFDYFSSNFSPYQYQQMRIMEFPRYAVFAQSFANTVPFSEGIGFSLKIEEDDVDMAYYVTAHELAHQWWAHQVTEANVIGNAMCSETMSQYSALMVMKKEYPEEMMQKFLKYELDRYLRGRSSETIKEQPLMYVERQNYIHYRKGSLIMYALQDYIGEDSVNAALRKYIHDWSDNSERYVTSADLVGYFKSVTPDSLQYIIEDMFETITLFENKTKVASYSEISKDKYEVSLTINAVKMRSDTLGMTSEVPMNDWIDIGVYGEQVDGKDRLIYLKKHKIKEGDNQLILEINEKPVKAGIDPIHKLIDRNPEDNVLRTELNEEEVI